jgi:hypothetical protein
MGAKRFADLMKWPGAMSLLAKTERLRRVIDHRGETRTWQPSGRELESLRQTTDDRTENGAVAFHLMGYKENAW